MGVGIALALAIVAGVAIAFDPSARVLGWVRGEPFFQGRAATAWNRDLSNPDAVHSNQAIETLAAGKKESLPVCAWLARHAAQSQVRTRAIEAMAKMGKEAAPAGPDLVAALADPDPLVRSAAARTIGGLAPDVPGAVSALVRCFPDRDAIRAVAEFKQAGAEAVVSLIQMTRHPDAAIRRQVVRTMGKIGPASLDALPNLIALTTSDAEAGVREQSAEAIGEIGPAAAAGIPALVKALGDENAKVRRDAVRSLGQMGPTAKGSLKEVLALVNDPDDDVKKAAKDAARKIDPAAKH
jgi:HEAT repeat protein